MHSTQHNKATDHAGKKVVVVGACTSGTSFISCTRLDEGLTVSCPVPPDPLSLTGSATAARPNLFAVSRFTGLEGSPNVHGPLEAIEVDDKKRGKVTKYRALSNHQRAIHL